METLKEQWIDKVLQSTESLERAKSNPFLWAKFKHKLQSVSETIPAKQVWAWAMALALLLLTNIFSVLSSNTQTNDTQEFVQQYHLLSSD